MSLGSPDVVLYDSLGNALSVQNATAIPASTPALLVAGSDGTNSRYITIDTSGRLLAVGAGVAGTPAGGVITIQGVSGGTVVPISGTVTANIGTTNGLALDTTLAKLTITQGTALGSNTQSLIGGSVTTAAPTYTTGQISPISLTTAGAIRIDGSAVTQPISGTVTANAGTGNFTVVQSTASSLNATIVGTGTDNTANSTAKLPVISALANTSAPTWIDGRMAPLSVDTTGALRITGSISATNPSVSTTAAAPPASATYIGGSVTTAAPTYTTGQMDPLSLTTAGALRIDGSAVTQPVSGTIAATQSGTWTVQPGNTANTTPWLTTISQGGNSAIVSAAGALKIDGSAVTQPVSGTVTANVGTTNGLALDTTLAKLTITQGAALGSNTQVLIGGSVTTAAPTYTTGQISPLSFTTAGAVRIDGSGVTQPVSGTVAATQSGTWTVQPGNTANTTPWLATISQGGNSASVSASNALKVDGSAATQPVSGTVTANIGTSGSLALDATLSAQSLVDNAAFTDGTSRVVPSGHIFDEVAGTALTENDVGASRMDSKRSQVMVIEDATTRGQRVTITASNAMKIDGSAVTQPVSGTVTANVGTTNGLALDATLTKLTITQGTALGSNTQALIGGSVTTAAPTYTTGQISPISLTTAGAVRIDGSGATQPVSGTVTANIGTTNGLALDTTLSAQSMVDNAAFTDGTSRIISAGYIFDEVAGTALTENDGAAARIDSKRAQVNVLEDATTRGTRNTIKAASTAAVATDTALVVAISPNNAINAGAIDVTGTGTLNALNTTAQIAVQSESNAGMQLLAGTLVGTIVPEVSYDGATTWVAGFFDDPSTGNKVSSIVFGSSNTATTRTIVGVGGASHVRVRVSAFTSGTATCNLRGSVFNRTSLLSEGAFTATTQPPDAIQISGWDGSNLRVPAVKAPSTAPVATDQAMVVVLSPNQPAIPVSTSPINSTPNLVFGDITLSSNASTVKINRTTYTEQTVNFTGSIKSSSAADASAGTGARTGTIYYVDSTGATAGTETFTLNGTTAVNLVTTTKCFIEKIIINTAGSGGVNAGTISLFTAAAGGGTTVGTIAVGDNRTHWCQHYVVTGKICNVTNVSHSNSSSVSGGTSAAHIRALAIGVTNAAEIQISEFVDVGGAQNPSLKAYGSTIQVTGPARLAMYVLPGANTTTIYRGSIDCYDL